VVARPIPDADAGTSASGLRSAALTDVLLELLLPAARKSWQALALSERIARMQQHRLLPIALAHAREIAALDALNAGLWESLMTAGRHTADQDCRLLERVLPVLNGIGCRTLLLKGAALGRWLYATPELRPGSDIDLLIDSRYRLAAHDALTAAGMRSDGYSQHDHASNQAAYVDPDSGRQIDLHWALSVVPELACRFDFSELCAGSIELAEPRGARALGRVDALMHCVIHFHAHQPGNERPLIWLHDLALLVRGLDAGGWDQLDRKVRCAELAGLHAAAVQEAARWFPLPLPEQRVQQWQQLGQGECTSALLHPDRSPVQRLWHSLTCMTTLRGRLAYLRARLLPTSEWMRGRYAATNGLQLTRAYLRRWADGLRQVVNARS
jgi:hypothetical protein